MSLCDGRSGCFHGINSTVDIPHTIMLLTTSQAHKLQIQLHQDNTQKVPQQFATATQIADPYTIEGQQPDTIHTIKHKPHGSANHYKGCLFEVGDYIQILARNPGDSWRVRAKNLRTGDEGNIIWKAVYPCSTRELCDCHEWDMQCSCVYTDFEASRASSV